MMHYFLSFLIILISIEVLAYTFLPLKLTTNLRYYKKIMDPMILGRGYYPRNYFVPHESRGFDIGKEKKGFYHWLDGGTRYPIWSNKIGCFDTRVPFNKKEYIYLAGDSYTWGYAAFHKKFGTLLGPLVDKNILQCGVTHTGQSHQYSKMREIIGELNIRLSHIIVMYFSNDIKNDYAHPHSTVIDGWWMDKKRLDKNGKLKKWPEINPKVYLGKRLKYLEKKRSKWSYGLDSYFKKYSILYSATRNLFSSNNHILYSNPGRKSWPIDFLKSEKNNRLWYFDNPISFQNKLFIKKFKNYSKEKNIPLTFFLIPHPDHLLDTQYYSELHEFLKKNNIRYIDLSTIFKKMNLHYERVYALYHGHFNESGNRIVANIIANYLSGEIKETNN